MSKIAATTIVRHDVTLLKLWVEYYGNLLGYENLYVVLDGDDWAHPDFLEKVNVEIVTISPKRRVDLDLWSADFGSKFVNTLLETYTCVLRADVDEFIVVDPDVTMGFSDYVLSLAEKERVFALGVDVVHNREKEPPLILGDTPILSQRKHAVLTREFSKPCVVFTESFWAEGFHRIHGQQIQIDENLFMFHLALFDYDLSLERIKERKTVSHGADLDAHIESRMVRFDEVAETQPFEGDDYFDKARAQIEAPKANGKPRVRPGYITEGNNLERGYLVTIPERFETAI